MNIKEVKEELKRTIQSYLWKDEKGKYQIPTLRQRPVLLMGPPGIGKTAIMEQIAKECGIALVSYTITHHTRQSAVGLPTVQERKYGGKVYGVTEYTMSEIIASVYETMERTGLKEGILFIDEINCVSETLAPTMLQFLQAKTFGTHKVPEGFVIVAAGNPPEYNRSVREFDIVTLDRVKRIDVTADMGVWMEYAKKQLVHPCILSYLEIKPEHFYHIETTVEGMRFVTARGWEDMSSLLYAYENFGYPVTDEVVLSYVQDRAIAKDFAMYTELYKKYKEDYKVDEILKGKFGKRGMNKLKKAPFDEHVSLIGLLLGNLRNQFKDAYVCERMLEEVFPILQNWKERIANLEGGKESILTKILAEYEGKKKRLAESGILTGEQEQYMELTLAFLQEQSMNVFGEMLTTEEESFEFVKKEFQNLVDVQQERVDAVSAKLENAFSYLEQVFSNSQEMVIFITNLTADFYASEFISENGCESYYKYQEDLLFEKKATALKQDIAAALAQWD